MSPALAGGLFTPEPPEKHLCKLAESESWTVPRDRELYNRARGALIPTAGSSWESPPMVSLLSWSRLRCLFSFGLGTPGPKGVSSCQFTWVSQEVESPRPLTILCSFLVPKSWERKEPPQVIGGVCPAPSTTLHGLAILSVWGPLGS